MNFEEQLASLNINPTKEQLALFDQFYQLLIAENKKTNLTAITEHDEVYLKHFYDSLTIAKDYSFTDQRLIDVGGGAGFPSIPLKIIYPGLEVTIIDGLGKRITFLNKVIKDLKLSKICAIHARAEEFAKEHREKYDIVIARAVARLNILDELCFPLIKTDGDFLALKGWHGDIELEEAAKGIQTLGGKIVKDHAFTLTEDDHHRHNIIIHKIKKTPHKYPRPYGQIKNKPL